MIELQLNLVAPARYFSSDIVNACSVNIEEIEMSVSSIMAEKLLRKYRKAFADAGWNLNASGAGAAENIQNLDGPLLYFCDVESGKLVVTATIDNVFSIADEFINAKRLDYQTVCNTLGSLLEDVFKDRVALDAECSAMLALGACMYLKGTQGYAVVQSQGLGPMHYLIMRQWSYADNTPLLRPVPIAPKPHYQPEEIECIVEQVLSIDRENHPNRFKSAEVVRFSIKSRTDL